MTDPNKKDRFDDQDETTVFPAASNYDPDSADDYDDDATRVINTGQGDQTSRFDDQSYPATEQFNTQYLPADQQPHSTPPQHAQRPYQPQRPQQPPRRGQRPQGQPRPRGPQGPPPGYQTPPPQYGDPQFGRNTGGRKTPIVPILAILLLIALIIGGMMWWNNRSDESTADETTTITETTTVEPTEDPEELEDALIPSLDELRERFGIGSGDSPEGNSDQPGNSDQAPEQDGGVDLSDLENLQQDMQDRVEGLLNQ